MLRLVVAPLLITLLLDLLVEFPLFTAPVPAFLWPEVAVVLYSHRPLLFTTPTWFPPGREGVDPGRVDDVPGRRFDHPALGDPGRLTELPEPLCARLLPGRELLDHPGRGPTGRFPLGR